MPIDFDAASRFTRLTEDVIAKTAPTQQEIVWLEDNFSVNYSDSDYEMVIGNTSFAFPPISCAFYHSHCLLLLLLRLDWFQVFLTNRQLAMDRNSPNGGSSGFGLIQSGRRFWFVILRTCRLLPCRQSTAHARSGNVLTNYRQLPCKWRQPSCGPGHIRRKIKN